MLRLCYAWRQGQAFKQGDRPGVQTTVLRAAPADFTDVRTLALSLQAGFGGRKLYENRIDCGSASHNPGRTF